DQEWDYFDQDDDGDIMSDAFETTHGFDPLNASDALENADGDSMNNLSEYIAGTLPHDASSVFAIEQLVPLENGHVQIQWLGVPGRLYTVWGTDNLSFDFVKLREPEESLGAVESYVDMRSNITESFYKVEVGLP
ncbi:MAG: hypothetical protein NWR08_09780, partial [Opitutales bacterium]|nr:hypothetical protein [Opitutales bacterium]